MSSRDPNQRWQEVTVEQLIFALVVVLVLIAIIYAILQWAISILPFILGLLGVYYFGKHLLRQLLRYGFSKRTSMTLLLSAATALLLSILFVSIFKIRNDLLNIVLFAFLFTFSATVALEFWVFRYFHTSLSRLKDLTNEEDSLLSKTKELGRDIEKLDQHLRSQQQQYSGAFSEEKRLLEHIDSICKDVDWYRRRKDYERQYSELTVSQLQQSLDNIHPGKSIDRELQRAVLQWVMLRKQNEPIRTRIETDSKILNDKKSELQQLSQQIQSVREQRKQQESRSQEVIRGAFIELRSEMREDFTKFVGASKRLFYLAYNGFINLMQMWKSRSQNSERSDRE